MSVLGLRSQAGLAPPAHPEDTATATAGLLTRVPSQDAGDTQSEQLPTLVHRLRHSSSILALALSDENIYAGTHGGEILVYSLRTYERKATIEGHRGSVLGLCLSTNGELLFSSGGDRIVNVWKTTDLSRQCCLYSSYDVGDIFCVAYSTALRTVYLGAQNTTIQWCSQDQKACSKQRAQTPGFQGDPFFDSRGPGGARTPRPADADILPKDAQGGDVIEIGRENVRHFAHYGYVYCMILAKTIPEAVSQEILVTGGGDGVVKLWRLDKKNAGAPDLLYQLDDGREEGHSIHSVSVEGTFLYSGRSGGEIDVWDLETRQLIRNLKAHRDDVLTICVAGGFMFSAAVTGYVRKFDQQYQLKSRLRAHEGRILASAFKSDRRRSVYVTGGSDSTIAVWDVSDCVESPNSSLKSTNEQLVDSLAKLVGYRTVSSNPQYALECRRGASYLRSVFKNFGATTEMLSTDHGHNPIILARFKGNPATRAKRKRILFYGHYDVVSAENKAGKWIVDPFAMEGIDGYVYGRGTSDNKGPIMAAIFACAELMSEQALGSDIVFLIEGEEECGSRGFEKAVTENKDLIGDIDWILLANSYWLDDRIPCLTYGLRGVVHAKVQIESSHPDMHSGVDGSAELDESLKDLVMLLSKLTGKDGEVKIPCFYDPILPLAANEKALYEDIANALIHRNPDLGKPAPLMQSLMRRWREAALTMHRFTTSGPANASVIPRLAQAAISMRLVPNQESTKIAQLFTTFLQKEFARLESNNKLTITIDHQAEPWLGDWQNEIYQTLEEAIVDVWGPIEHTRRRSSAQPPKVALSAQVAQEMSGSYFTSMKSPTTSERLASGSADPPQPSLSPLGEVAAKLEDLAASTSPTTNKRASGRHSRQNSKASTTSSTTSGRTSINRKKPLYIREGGSIPAIRFLEKEFGAPAAHFPVGQASDNAHLDNERLRLVNLYRGREVFKRVFRELPCK